MQGRETVIIEKFSAKKFDTDLQPTASVIRYLQRMYMSEIVSAQ